jgi:hypothetical protein
MSSDANMFISQEEYDTQVYSVRVAILRATLGTMWIMIDDTVQHRLKHSILVSSRQLLLSNGVRITRFCPTYCC